MTERSAVPEDDGRPGAAALLAAAQTRWAGRARPFRGSDGRARIALFDLFTLDLHGVLLGDEPEDDRPARLVGWDRDLSPMLTTAASAGLDAVLDDVDRAIHEVASPDALAPTVARARELGLLETPPELTWSEKRDAAVEARRRREARDPAAAWVDHDDLLRRVARKWPGAVIERTREIDWVVRYRLRPRGTFRVGVGQVFREGIQGDILAATVLREALGPISSDDTAASVDRMLDRMDAWLALTMPPPDVLALPIVATD